MPRQVLRTIVCFLLAHLASIFLFLLVFIPGYSLTTGTGRLSATPILALIILPQTFLVSVPYVLPFAIPLTVLACLRPYSSRITMLIASCFCGLGAISLMNFVMPTMIGHEEFPLALCSAAIAGTAGGWIFQSLIHPRSRRKRASQSS